MEQMFLELFKISPMIGILGIMYYHQRKDYTKLVEDTRTESKEREEKMQKTIDKNQETISKNQDIIGELATKLNVVQEVKEDVEQIKTYIFK